MRQLCTGTPSSQTVQAPQSPGVAALLDAEPAEVAQEGAQALAGRRLFGEGLAVDVKAHVRSPQAPAASSAPNLLGEVVGQVLAVGRRAVHVVEVAVVGDRLVQARRAARRRPGHGRSVICTGRGVAAVTVSVKAPSPEQRVPIRSAVDRPMWVSGMRRKAARRAQRPAGMVDCAQQLARLQNVLMVAGDEVHRRHSRSPPSLARKVQTPSSDEASEIIGPAGSDMQTLPPTVAVFQILNEARKARQHSPISGAACQSGGASKA